MTSLTLFKAPRWWEAQQRYVYDNKTHRRMNFESFEGLEELLYRLSERKLNDKLEAELICPAIFKEGTTRANRNVIEWAGWAAVDVDDHEFEGDLKNELYRRYGDWYYVCYSTASSTSTHPKFRLVFPLKSSVGSDKIKGFWHALNTELGSVGDKQTKDLARMYYTPASYEGAHNFIFTNDGSYMDPDALVSKHPLPKKPGGLLENLPEELRAQILSHRVESLNNRNYKWNSYQDCPFVSKTAVTKYKSITGTGWYAGMYRLMISIASRAIEMRYPITPAEVAQLCREIDYETGGWYENRPLEREAQNAINYAITKVG